MPDRESTIRSIKSTLRWLVWATVALYVALGAAVFWTYHEAATTQDALCALRSDLVVRVSASQKFLLDHPNGVGGIPAKAIRDGIQNQERTIAALADLSC